MRFARLAVACVGLTGLLAMVGGAFGESRVPVTAKVVNAAGESIYLNGVSANGKPVQAVRSASGLRSAGKDTACVNCHLHSGLGTVEGHVIVPPVTGRYLFQPPATDRKQPDLPYVDGMHRDRQPYTDASLARAIREGVDSEGRTLGYLMPRFALDDADMAALLAYLKAMGAEGVPGVTDTVLHFATIITPDADPVKRQGMLDVMQQYFKEKNTRALKTLPKMHTSENTMYSKTMYMVNRRWQLHVWELQGPPDTWEPQLEKFLEKEPVFAVISGLGGSNWSPVHRFCESEHLPCLFPNVEVPMDEGGYYTLYLSRGVLLEAGLIARAIADPEKSPVIHTVRQVYREGDSGAAAAQAFGADLKDSGIAVENVVLPGSGHGKLPANALAHLAPGEALVLWLRPDDIAALGPLPAQAGPVYFSGLMGGLERAPLAADWRERAWLAYPFDLPDRRRVRVDFPLGWFRIRNIPVVAEQVQADTYLACGLLAETLSHMVDTFVRDYLVERFEENLEHRIMTGYYPRLTLSEGERFASKGGFVVRFADPKGEQLVATRDWTTP